MHYHWWQTYSRLFRNKETAVEAVNAGAMGYLIEHARSRPTGGLAHESATSRILEALLRHDEALIAFSQRSDFNAQMSKIIGTALGPAYSVQLITRLFDVKEAWNKIPEDLQKRALEKVASAEYELYLQVPSIIGYSKKQLRAPAN